jgi:iron(III) transport system ATP-binding protein
MPIIELSEVTKTYQGERPLRNASVPAVYDVSFQIEKGEVLALLGPSGSGKTTLLRLIAGFETPESGKIILDGRDVSVKGQVVPPEKRGIGMVFQDSSLFPHLTVRQNIAFGLYRYNKNEQERKVLEMIGLVGLTGFLDRYPHELSGGQQQRVALARALAPSPIVLLMDEPFSNLDPDMRSKMREEVHAILKRVSMTAILVTHDHEEAFTIADKVAVLNAGKIEQIDTPEMIYHLPKTYFVADFVGSADFIEGEVTADGKIYTEIGAFPNEIGRGGSRTAPNIVVMIRPDDIHLIPDPNGIAKIVSKQFRGSENLYKVLLPSGAIVHSSEHSLVDYPHGMNVRIALTATHTVVFSASSIKGRG